MQNITNLKSKNQNIFVYDFLNINLETFSDFYTCDYYNNKTKINL